MSVQIPKRSKKDIVVEIEMADLGLPTNIQSGFSSVEDPENITMTQFTAFSKHGSAEQVGVEEPDFVVEKDLARYEAPNPVSGDNGRQSPSQCVDQQPEATEVCRYCHMPADVAEDCIDPCLCKGTMGTVHKQCLERWLAVSRNTTCEVCNFRYLAEFERKYTRFESFTAWKTSLSPTDRRWLCIEIALFIAACIGAVYLVAVLWLVGQKAVDSSRLQMNMNVVGLGYEAAHMNHGHGLTEWEALTLTVFVEVACFLVCLVFIFIVIRKHYKSWNKWAMKHDRIISSVLPVPHVREIEPQEPVATLHANDCEIQEDEQVV